MNTLYNVVNKNRAEELRLSETLYLTEHEKNCYNKLGCIPIITNCESIYLEMKNPDDDKISCPSQLYKQIKYKLRECELIFTNSELKTITGNNTCNSLIDVLTKAYKT